MEHRERYALWLKNPDGWKETVAANCDHGYGFSPIAVAAFWMLAMQDVIAEGGPLDDALMEQTQRETNAMLGRWSLTGFQMGMCVSIVAQVWEHGEEVRRWWNLSTQIGDEGEKANESGGTLNPALLGVSKR